MINHIYIGCLKRSKWRLTVQRLALLINVVGGLIPAEVVATLLSASGRLWNVNGKT